jgi:hypothetical protein
MYDPDDDGVAILCHACEARKNLWGPYRYFMRKHCDFLPWANIYISSEKGDAGGDDHLFRDIATGEGEWSDRLMVALDQIPDPRVFFMCEDYWLTETWTKALWWEMSHKHWLNVGGTWDIENTDAVRWRTPSPFYKLEEFGRYLNGSKYAMSMEATMWRKDFLRACLVPRETVWDMETKGTRRMWKKFPLANLYLETWEGYENAWHKHRKTTHSGLSALGKRMMREYVHQTVHDRAVDAEG